VKKTEEIKQLVEFRQCTNTTFQVKYIFAFPHFTRLCRSTSYLMWHSKASSDCLLYRQHFCQKYQNSFICVKVIANQRWDVFETRCRMWANAQRDGRLAEYRWRHLFNAAKFVSRHYSTVPFSNTAKTRNPLKLPGVPQTNQTISI